MKIALLSDLHLSVQPLDLPFFLAAATAAQQRHQLALLDVELLLLVDHPLVVTAAAQGIALMRVLECGPAKGNDLRHARLPLPQHGLLQRAILPFCGGVFHR